MQVGSHCHFFEVNRWLAFDRAAAYGMRLNIAAGTAVRFEPGDTREVELVALGGTREVVGLNQLVEGPLDEEKVKVAALKAVAAFSSRTMKIDRRTYADHYGPTTGDRIRLADTDLIVRIEHDATSYGDEAKFGGGKVIRDGMGQSPTASRQTGIARPGHHQRRDRRRGRDSQGGRRHSRRSDLGHRQGRAIPA